MNNLITAEWKAYVESLAPAACSNEDKHLIEAISRLGFYLTEKRCPAESGYVDAEEFHEIRAPLVLDSLRQAIKIVENSARDAGVEM